MEARLRELKQKEDEKTAKNREKRLKKKNKGKAQQQPEQQHADAVPIVVPAKESKKEETSSTNKVDTKAQVEQPSHAIVRPDTIKIIDEDSF